MSNFFPVSGPLHEQHQASVDGSLPAELHQGAFRQQDLDGFSESDIARGRAAWQSRVLEAYGLLIRYSQFAADLAQTHARSEVVGLASRAAWDRNCHFELCCRMVQCLGGTLKLSHGDWSAYQTLGETAHERVMHALAGPICLEETVSIRILAELARNTQMDVAKRTILHVARVETQHWRLGWQLLTAMWEEYEDSDRGKILKRLPDAFHDAKERFYMGRLGSQAGNVPKTQAKPSHSFGSMAVHQRASIVSETMTRAAERFVQIGVPSQSLANYL